MGFAEIRLASAVWAINCREGRGTAWWVPCESLQVFFLCLMITAVDRKGPYQGPYE